MLGSIKEKGMKQVPAQTETIILIGRKKIRNVNFMVKDATIVNKRVVKYLEDYFDQGLTFGEHVRQTSLFAHPRQKKPQMP